MPAQNKDAKKKDDVPPWFKGKPTQASKARYEDACVSYILHHKLREKLPKANVETYKAMLPWVRVFSPAASLLRTQDRQRGTN